jgi:hypothetical protein
MTIEHAEDFGIILSSGKNANDGDSVDLFLSHSATRTAEFLEKVRPQFLEIYQNNPARRLGFVRNIMKICLRLKEKHKEISLPDYIETMREEQIKALITQIFDLHQRGDKGNKKTTNALQELETLKACEFKLFERLSSTKYDACDSSFHLFKFSAVTENQPQYLYILTSKPKERGAPPEGGVLANTLIEENIEDIAKSFRARNNDKAAIAVITKLTKHFAPDTPKVKASFIDAGITYHMTYHQPTQTIPDMSHSFELTGKPKRIDSTHESPPDQNNWDHVPVQQYQPREVGAGPFNTEGPRV